MAPLTHEQSLQRLTALYRDAFRCDPDSPHVVIAWAEKPELWAEHQLRHRGWSWHACEAIVRQCRIHRRRARIAMEAQA